MGGGAKRYTLCDGMCDPEQFTQRDTKDVAQNACNGNHSRGDRDIAACLSTQSCAHCCRNALGKQRCSQHLVKAKKSAHYQHEKQAGYGACTNSGHNRFPILAQELYLLIQGYSQADGSGGDQPGNALHFCLIICIGIAGNLQNDNHENDGNQQRIAQGGFELFLE